LKREGGCESALRSLALDANAMGRPPPRKIFVLRPLFPLDKQLLW
jgi:hypothetical protein